MNEDYIARINRVIDYIDANIDRDFSLKSLAEVGCFSKYHFHRIFKAVTGETLHQFTKRLRVEKAATMLINCSKKSITEIAFDCGFTSSAGFARSFRDRFKMSPSNWRSQNFLKNSKKWKDFDISCYYLEKVSSKRGWSDELEKQKLFKIEIKNMEEFYLGYLRHRGSYKGDEQLFASLFQRLRNWAEPRGLLNFPKTNFVTVYHDSLTITAEDKLRISVGLTVPKETSVQGEIGKMKIKSGKFAIISFGLSAGEDYQEAWNFIFGKWFIESNYQPADGFCYEKYLNNPKDHPEGICFVDICIPVKPL